MAVAFESNMRKLPVLVLAMVDRFFKPSDPDVALYPSNRIPQWVVPADVTLPNMAPYVIKWKNAKYWCIVYSDQTLGALKFDIRNVYSIEGSDRVKGIAVQFIIEKTVAGQYTLRLESMDDRRADPALLDVFIQADKVDIVETAEVQTKGRPGRLDMMYMLTHGAGGVPSRYGKFQNLVDYPGALKRTHNAIYRQGQTIDREAYTALSQTERINRLKTVLETLVQGNNLSDQNRELHDRVIQNIKSRRVSNNWNAMRPLYQGISSSWSFGGGDVSPPRIVGQIDADRRLGYMSSFRNSPSYRS